MAQRVEHWRGIASFIAKNQGTIAPGRQNCGQFLDLTDLRQIEALRLLGRFAGYGGHPIKTNTLCIGVGGFHRPD